MNEDLNTPSPTNKHSITSLIFGILTLFSLCTASLPVPFTGFICLPAGFLFSLIALIYGSISLSQIRKSKETGSPMAWIGIISGGFMFLCILCMIAAIVSLFIFAPNYLPSTPFFDNYQL
jgi:hypothetical protein